MKRLKAVSLFSCIGVGEYYLKDIGIDVVLANEIEPKRCDTYSYFHPSTKMVCGDITDKKVKQQILKESLGLNIDLVIATPPCQGMSLN